MKNKIRFCMLFLLSLSLCSCQLAVAGGDSLPVDDQLIGVFITGEYLNLWDYQQYLKDNAPDLFGEQSDLFGYEGKSQDGDAMAMLTTDGYDRRLEGQPVLNEDGQIDHFIFKGLTGVSIYRFQRTAKNGEQEHVVYHTPRYAENVTCTTADKNAPGLIWQEITLDATLYLNEKVDDWVDHESDEERIIVGCFANPVYQRADGTVYLSAGTGSSYQAEGSGIYSVGGQSYAEQQTETINGEMTATSFHLNVSFMASSKMEGVRILELYPQNKIGASQDYLLAELENGIATDAESLIVTYLNGDGDAMKRLVVTRNETDFPFYLVGDETIFQLIPITIDWR